MARSDAPSATEYVVLERRQLTDGEGPVTAWVEAGKATKTSRAGAATEVADGKEGVFRPVPRRNWGKAIKIVNETTIKTTTEEVED